MTTATDRLAHAVRVVYNEGRSYLCTNDPATSATPLGPYFRRQLARPA